jgi:hypothetical protein
MRSIGRMVAMSAAAVAMVAGGATLAQAQTEGQHTTTCATEDACIKLRNITQHNGYDVSEVFWRDPEATCPPEGSCGGGWQFLWD